MNWYKYDIRDLADAEYHRWYSFMDEDKQARVNRFRFTDDKKRTVAGEMLARKAISEWCGISPEEIVFYIKSHGKPYAKGLTVEFNISHSGYMVVCAIDNKPIGIDIEEIRPIDLTVAKRICNDDELIYIFGRTPTYRDFAYTDDAKVLTRFFELWTAKEAYGKLNGTGLYGLSTKPLKCLSYYLKEDYVVSISTYQNQNDSKE